MVNEDQKKVLAKALQINGDDFQIDMAKEEIAELISELGKCITNLSSLLAGVNHLKRNKIVLGDLCGEIADAELTLNYLRMVTDPVLIDEFKEFKIKRLQKILEGKI